MLFISLKLLKFSLQGLTRPLEFYNDKQEICPLILTKIDFFDHFLSSRPTIPVFAAGKRRGRAWYWGRGTRWWSVRGRRDRRPGSSLCPGSPATTGAPGSDRFWQVLTGSDRTKDLYQQTININIYLIRTMYWILTFTIFYDDTTSSINNNHISINFY